MENSKGEREGTESAVFEMLRLRHPLALQAETMDQQLLESLNEIKSRGENTIIKEYYVSR